MSSFSKKNNILNDNNVSVLNQLCRQKINTWGLAPFLDRNLRFICAFEAVEICQAILFFSFSVVVYFFCFLFCSCEYWIKLCQKKRRNCCGERHSDERQNKIIVIWTSSTIRCHTTISIWLNFLRFRIYFRFALSPTLFLRLYMLLLLFILPFLPHVLRNDFVVRARNNNNEWAKKKTHRIERQKANRDECSHSLAISFLFACFLHFYLFVDFSFCS